MDGAICFCTTMHKFCHTTTVMHFCHALNALDVHLLPVNTRLADELNLPHAAPASLSTTAPAALTHRRSQQPQHAYDVALAATQHCMHATIHAARRLHTPQCSAILHTPRAAQHVVHINHCTALLGTAVHHTSNREATPIHTKGSICSV